MQQLLNGSKSELAEQQIIDFSKRIDYYISEYTIEILAGKMREGEYIVPAYQREFTWEENRKSKFIESLLIGLPIPFLFFWEEPTTGKLEIVDGSQRLRTIEEFLFDELVLEDLERLTELNDLKFSDLPESRQRKIKNKSIRGIVLGEGTDGEARFDLFERINTGSKVANKAEVRRGALQGPFMSLVVELAQDPLFIQLAPLSEKSLKERVREELVTRFFAYGDGLDEYADEVSPFLFAYSQKMNHLFQEHPEAINDYKDRFSKTMNFINAAFPNGFRKTPSSNATPRSRFEAIAVGTFLALNAKPTLAPSVENVSSWINDEQFIKETRSDGANAIKRLEGRIGFVKNALLMGC
jgi:hypothetical protein